MLPSCFLRIRKKKRMDPQKGRLSPPWDYLRFTNRPFR